MSEIRLPLMTFTEASSRAAARQEREAFAATNERGERDVTEFERGAAVLWTDADDAPPPFVERDYLRGLLHGVGLTALVVLALAMWLLGTMIGR